MESEKSRHKPKRMSYVRRCEKIETGNLPARKGLLEKLWRGTF
jgi:hypothetical protein